MTLEDYSKKLDELRKNWKANETLEALDKLIDLKFEYMESVLAELTDVHNSPEMKEVCDILNYLIYESQYGNVISFCETKELAEKTAETVEKVLGDYTLEYPQVYEREGRWAVDCMFGYDYCPGYDEDEDE